jgi:hypothetical protein
MNEARHTHAHHHPAKRCLAVGATVVTTLFAPGDELDSFAGRFPLVGAADGRVVTLLVEDASRGCCRVE